MESQKCWSVIRPLYIPLCEQNSGPAPNTVDTHNGPRGVYSSLKTSRDGRHYLFNKCNKPLSLNIFRKFAKIKFFFIKIKVFICFLDKLKVLKDFMQNIGF